MAETILSASEAKKRIRSGKQTTGIVVESELNLSDIRGLSTLPRNLRCYELNLSGTSIKRIPASLKVECALNLHNCRKLETLPNNLEVGTLDISGCTSLKKLPQGLCVWFLNAEGCRGLTELPADLQLQNGGLNVRQCRNLQSLPDSLGGLATLDISDCPLIDDLPDSLRIGQWADVAGSGLRDPHKAISKCIIRWRGVPINEKIAFRPEKITAKETLKESNAERRRVMIERMDFEKFMRQAGGKVIDKDQDPGGKRELIRVPLKDDEDIICLSCSCPSTQRHYLLRVPPSIKGCHQAAAWMAGFDDPKKYKPLIET